jgi:hypothetical protein
MRYFLVPDRNPSVRRKLVLMLSFSSIESPAWAGLGSKIAAVWEVLLKLKYLPEEVQENLTAAVRRGVVLGGS